MRFAVSICFTTIPKKSAANFGMERPILERT